jgi:glutamine amidotransferase
MQDNKIIIIDYGLGNLFSIAQAIIKVGGTPHITSDKKEIAAAQHLILPGVGAFGNAMDSLKRLDLVAPLMDYVAEDKPLMGVCLGMQILFEESEEFGYHQGLGVIKGSIKKFSPSPEQKVKVPQIGWNQIQQVKKADWDASPLRGLKDQEFMYFVHSYYAAPKEQDVVLTRSHYAGIEYCSSVKKSNVVAFQFHPEKSGAAGLSIYKEFIQ